MVVIISNLKHTQANFYLFTASIKFTNRTLGMIAKHTPDIVHTFSLWELHTQFLL